MRWARVIGAAFGLRFGALLAAPGFVLPAACAAASRNALPELPRSSSHPLLDAPLPQVTGVTLDGRRLHAASFEGRPLVVKFFAEYCEPCKRTLPAAEQVHRAHPEVVFIGVSLDDRASTAARLREGYGLSFSIVHDRSHVLQGRFRVNEMPVTFVADRAGVVRWVGGPEQKEKQLEQAVAAIDR